MPDDLPPYLMKTERLRLVPLDATRADELAALYADPAVSYTHLTLPTNREV